MGFGWVELLPEDRTDCRSVVLLWPKIGCGLQLDTVLVQVQIDDDNHVLKLEIISINGPFGDQNGSNFIPLSRAESQRLTRWIPDGLIL